MGSWGVRVGELLVAETGLLDCAAGVVDGEVATLAAEALLEDGPDELAAHGAPGGPPKDGGLEVVEVEVVDDDGGLGDAAGGFGGDVEGRG